MLTDERRGRYNETRGEIAAGPAYVLDGKLASVCIGKVGMKYCVPRRVFVCFIAAGSRLVDARVTARRATDWRLIARI